MILTAPAPHSRSTSTPCAVPITCKSRRPRRISSRSNAIGSRHDSPPPTATVIPSCTIAAASASETCFCPEVKTGILYSFYIIMDRVGADFIVRTANQSVPAEFLISLLDHPAAIDDQHVASHILCFVRGEVDRR